MASELRETIKEYSSASTLLALRELGLSFFGYAVFVSGIYYSYTHSIWWGYVLCSIIGGFFMIKVFAMQHDCGHRSLFANETANVWTGRLCSMVTTMPFKAWMEEHDEHHSHVVDIEKIGFGDILLLTVEQYQDRTPFMKFVYRVFRHPVFIILFAPFIYFFLKSKFPSIMNKDNVTSVLWTNVFVLGIYGTLVYFLGFWTVVFVFVPAGYIGGMLGMVLFYIQHDYPDATWFETGEWTHEDGSLEGSSLLILPQPLNWLSHSIGYHHIHHLDSKVPGYRLKDCYEETPAMQAVEPLTWRCVYDAFHLKLWSREKKSLINFSELESVAR